MVGYSWPIVKTSLKESFKFYEPVDSVYWFINVKEFNHLINFLLLNFIQIEISF